MNMDGVAQDCIRRSSVHEIDIAMNNLTSFSSQYRCAQDESNFRIDNDLDESFALADLDGLGLSFMSNRPTLTRWPARRAVSVMPARPSSGSVKMV
jgi:hypothetical protein